MGTIQAGIGIISGLPIDDIVTQLIAIDARPLRLVENQIARVQAQRTSFLEISARLLALKTSIARFDTPSFFQASKATSSNENVLLATAEENASPGSFSFQVRSLVGSHQLASNRFADRDRTPVGAGRISIEVGNGLLNDSTPLDQLNGQLGVRRGSIRITDRSGVSIDLDLNTALTVDDLLDVINTQTRVAVRATVSGDRIVLRDFSGGTGRLGVVDLGTGQLAADLGLAGSVASDTLTGGDLVYLTDRTSLDFLNDGLGIRTHGKKLDDFQITASDGTVLNVRLDDDLLKNRDGLTEAVRLDALNNGNGVRLGTIRITDRAGGSTEIDLSGAVTVADVKDAIESALGNVSVTLDNRSGFFISLTDTVSEPGENDPPTPNFVIEDVTGFAARDLGIAADVDDTTIEGSEIYRVSTLGDVIRAINFALDAGGSANAGRVIASLSTDGDGIVLTDSTGGAGAPLQVTALNGSGAMADLGLDGAAVGDQIQSGRLIAGLNTVLVRSINGGSGADLGALDVRLSDNTVAAIDLSGAQTVAEIIDRINGAGIALSAAINRAGNGIVVRDTSGGTNALVITDGAGGTAATDLNLLINANVTEVSSGNLQRKYISENTRLEDLRLGAGVARGKFRITDSNGATATVSLAEQDDQTLGDVMDEINALVIGVTARINDTGDGIVVIDTAGGTNRLKIEEQGSSVAADLNILGEAAAGTTEIDGSFEVVIEIDADDTLEDVRDKINASSAGASALIYSIGSSVDPFRLSLTSDTAGRRGRILVDTGTTGLSLTTQAVPRDAIVSYNGDLISSPTNTLDEFIRGVSIDLVGTDDETVTVTVAQDVDQVVEDIRSFTDSFNGVMDRIDELTRFDPEAPNRRGILQGDRAIRRIEQRLQNAVIFTVQTSNPTINRLTSVGIRFRGNRLSFDESVLREAMATDPDAVIEFFTQAEEGFGNTIKSEIGNLTREVDGLLARQESRLTSQEEQLNDRAGNLQLLLDAKEARLRAQFIAMEQVLATLQGQQNALAGLALLASNTINRGIGG